MVLRNHIAYRFLTDDSLWFEMIESQYPDVYKQFEKNGELSDKIEFDGEVGERSGSWKGGTLGCGYKLLPGEEPWQALSRMEKERKF